MKKFLLKRLLPLVGEVVQPVIKTVEDETGYYIKLKLYIFGSKVYSARVYLKRDSAGKPEPNQKIRLR